MRLSVCSLGAVLAIAACGANTVPPPSSQRPPKTTPSGAAGAPSAPAIPAADGGRLDPTSNAPAAVGGSGASNPGVVTPPATAGNDGCADNRPVKEEGCSCTAGATAPCWSGPVADRNRGKCHDGLQVCSTGEFPTWGACMGEEQDCGEPPPVDAGAPPDEDCTCIPGAVIQCSEDCSVGIICSLTATKTCLPDGSWSVCHEDPNVSVDLPGVQCRNMLHGCFDVLTPDSPAQGMEGEIYVGDCSKQFKCGHSPPPPPPPPTVDTPE
jgi:hypothetical protein